MPPLAAAAIVETAPCPSRIPVATLATDETAQAVALPSTRHEMKAGGMPVAAAFIPAIVETPSCPSRIPVATLAADESASCLSTDALPHMGAASAVRGSGKRPRCAWGGDSHTTGVVVKSLLPDGHGSARRSTDALG